MSNQNGRGFEDELFGLGIDPAAAQSELRLIRDIGLALRRSWRSIALVALVGGALAYAASYLMEVRYTSVSQVMIETRVAPAGDFTPVVTNIPTSITSLETELEVLRSVDLIGRIVDRFSLVDDPEFSDDEAPEPTGETRLSGVDLERERTIAAVARRSSIEQVGTVSAVYAISFSSNDPLKAPLLANALAEEYVAETRMAKLRSLELAQNWLAERTREMNAQLSDLSVRLERNEIGAPYSADEIETIKARNIAAERSMAQVERERAGIDNAIAQVKGASGGGQLLEAAQAIAAPSATLQSAIAAAGDGTGAGGAALEAALGAEIERLAQRSAALATQAENLARELAETSDILDAQARRDAESTRIENEIAVVEAIYRDLMTQLSRRTEQENYLDADARIISTARPPLNPSQPQRMLIAVAGALGFALLLMLAVMIREIAQRRMRNVREFEAGTGLPLIGVVPEVRPRNAPFSTFLGKDGAIAPELMRFARKLRWSILAELPGDPRTGRLAAGALAEDATSRRKTRGKAAAARGALEPTSSVASTGYGGTAEAGHTVIAGASANRGDGQSSSMLSLACSFADGGEKVLLIDCDFNNSPFAEMLAESDANLEYIRFDPRKAKQFIVETAYENLDVLPAPRAALEATQKIGAAEWWRLFRHLSTQYDRILLDTPPLMSGIDTAVLHQVADVVLLFARWNATTTGETRSMIKVLGDVGVTPLAVVATRIDLDQVRGYGDDALFYLGRSMTA